LFIVCQYIFIVISCWLVRRSLTGTYVFTVTGVPAGETPKVTIKVDRHAP